MNKAIVLLSGGLDSAVTLAVAKKQGFKCECLIFDYGQRHKREINSAIKTARKAKCKYEIVKIRMPWKGSALLDKKINVPLVTKSPLRLRSGQAGRKATSGIPSTYVPARNIIFLSFALSYAEAVNAQAIFIGAHQEDYSGYPDCREEFFHAFRSVIATGTRAGSQKDKIRIITPLLHKRKAEIIKLGAKLGVDFGLTWSCYNGGKVPCGKCDSCFFRAKGFAELGMEDPTIK